MLLSLMIGGNRKYGETYSARLNCDVRSLRFRCIVGRARNARLLRSRPPLRTQQVNFCPVDEDLPLQGLCERSRRFNTDLFQLVHFFALPQKLGPFSGESPERPGQVLHD